MNSKLNTMSGAEMNRVIAALRADTSGDYCRTSAGRVDIYGDSDDYYAVWRWIRLNGQAVWVKVYEVNDVDGGEEWAEDFYADELLADLACSGSEPDDPKQSAIRRPLRYKQTHHTKPRRPARGHKIHELFQLEGD